MDDALVVRGLEAFRRLAEDAQEALGRELALLLQDRREVPPVDELHRQELDAVHLAEVEDAQDVGVRDAARELDLALEALQRIGVLGDVGADELQGDVAVELLVVHEIDGAHAAHAEQALDAVPVTDLEARRQHDRGHAPRRLAGPLLERRGAAHRGHGRQLGGDGSSGTTTPAEDEPAAQAVLRPVRVRRLAAGADHREARPGVEDVGDGRDCASGL